MDGRRVYMLDEAAHKAGIRPSTLRLYVRLGHIIPEWGYNTEADRRIRRDRRRKCMLFPPESIGQIQAVRYERLQNVSRGRKTYWERHQHEQRGKI